MPPPLKRSKLSDDDVEDTANQPLEYSNLTPMELLPRELLWAIIKYHPGVVADLRLVNLK